MKKYLVPVTTMTLLFIISIVSSCGRQARTSGFFAGAITGTSPVTGHASSDDMPATPMVPGATLPDAGLSAEVALGVLTLSASTLRGEEWSAGAGFSLPFGTLSVFGLYEGKWEAGAGLELGKGKDFRGQPGLQLRP